MLEINRNNLFKDKSPYLQQHKGNPVNWQVWSNETLEYAKINKIPITSLGEVKLPICNNVAISIKTVPIIKNPRGLPINIASLDS